MARRIPRLGPATQLGFVVRDAEAAMHHWIDVLGVGPFIFMDRGAAQPPPVTIYRGTAVTVETRLAFAYHGDVQIELIEQTNDAPSPYRDFIAEGREGLQHLSYWVYDYAQATATVEAAGYRPVYIIPIAGGTEPIVYYESPASLGVMLELVPPQWRRSRETLQRALAAAGEGELVLRYETYSAFLAELRALVGKLE